MSRSLSQGVCSVENDPTNAENVQGPAAEIAPPRQREPEVIDLVVPLKATAALKSPSLPWLEMPADVLRVIAPHLTGKDQRAWASTHRNLRQMTQECGDLVTHQEKIQWVVSRLTALGFERVRAQLLQQAFALPHVTQIAIHDADLTDAALQDLVGFLALRCPQLQKFDLAGCSGLTQVNVASLTQLQTLNLGFCSGLTQVDVAPLTQLQKLDLRFCPRLDLNLLAPQLKNLEKNGTALLLA